MKPRKEAGDIVEKLLAIANVARKASLICDQMITTALEEHGYTEYEAANLLEFIKIFRTGKPKGEIVEELGMSPELMERFDKYKLAW